MRILGWRRQSIEEREDQAAKALDEQARIRELVTRPGFKTHLVDWIQAEIRNARIRPGEEREMLYQVGLRDGLELVYNRLVALQEAGRIEDV